MDYLGPINPPSADGHRYILLIADYMTKFIGGVCHHSADGTEVLNTWESNWGATFGWPQAIYCDNGSHFSNMVFQAATMKHGTRLEFGPVSHPQSTGLLERNVRLVKNQLQKWAVEREGLSLDRWHQALAPILVNLNCRHIENLGTSPAMAMLGFEPFSRHPGVLDALPSDDCLENTDSTSRELNLALIDAREELRMEIQDQRSLRVDTELPPPPRQLRTGTVVWERLDKPGKLHTKFHKTWGNLSTVVQQSSDVTYMTKNLVGPPKIRKIHVDDLKPYISRLNRLRPPSLEHLIQREEDVDNRQMLEDLSWDHPEEVG
jgi:hypothetical protein